MVLHARLEKKGFILRFQGSAFAALYLGTVLLFFPAFDDAFLLPKRFFAMVFAGWLAAFACFQRPFRFWRSGPYLPLMVFWAWMVLSGASRLMGREGLSPSAFERGVWIWTLFLFGVVAAAGSSLSWKKIEFFLLFSGGLGAASALAQTAGLDSGFSWTTRFGGRAFGTLGNPNYLAGHLIVLFPLLVVRFFSAKKNFARFFWLLFLAVAGWALWKSKTLGAFLALGFSLFLLFFVWPKEERPFEKKKIVMVIGALLFLLIALAGSDRMQKSTTLQQRAAIWRTMAVMVYDHPLAGVGLGQLRVVYPAYQHRATEEEAPAFVKTSHGHQEYLQIAAEGGVIGLLLFLWCLFAYFKHAKDVERKLSDPDQKKKLFGCVCAVAGAGFYALGNFPFQIPPTALVLAALFAAPAKMITPQKDFFSPRKGVPAAFFLALVCAGFFGRLLVLSAAKRFTQGEASLGNTRAASVFAWRLEHLAGRDDEAWALLARVYGGMGLLEKSLFCAEKALRWNALDVETRVAAAKNLFQTGRKQQALEYLRRAVGVAWNYSEAQFWLGVCAFESGFWEEAEKAFERTTRLLPEHADAWVNLGVCRIQSGDREGAILAWRRALAVQPSHPSALRYLHAAEGTGRKGP